MAHTIYQMKEKSIPHYPGLARQLRTLRFEDMPQPLFVGPPNRNQIKVKCENCNQSFNPQWSKPYNFEMSPVQSADGAIWIPSKIFLQCPSCTDLKHGGMLTFPNNFNYGSLIFFGDEASRRILGSELYLYAFIGMDEHCSATVNAELKKIKRLIRPLAEPNAWALHTTDIRNARWRTKNNIKLDGYEIDSLLL